MDPLAAWTLPHPVPVMLIPSVTVVPYHPLAPIADMVLHRIATIVRRRFPDAIVALRWWNSAIGSGHLVVVSRDHAIMMEVVAGDAVVLRAQDPARLHVLAAARLAGGNVYVPAVGSVAAVPVMGGMLFQAIPHVALQIVWRSAGGPARRM